MKKETTKVKINFEEYKKQLEEQLARVELLAEAQQQIDGLIEQVEGWRKDKFQSYEIVGKETNQAERDGELLWEVKGKWRPVPTSELEEDEKGEAMPYFREIWDYVPIAYEDMPEYRQREVNVLNIVLDALRGICLE